jgi:YihY family inner membrane protein
MNAIQKLVGKVDRFQQKHAFLGFPYAVIKKFGDDSGGYQAALITYYGFLSLFPLILVAVMVMQLLFQNDPTFRAQVVGQITDFVPIVGNQLQENIHTSKTGLGLVVAILITLYGARGAADALRFALDNMWQIPHHRRAGFPKNLIRSFGVIGTAGLGLVASVAVSSFTTVLGHATWVKVLVNVLGAVILTIVLTLVFRIATSRNINTKDMLVGSVFGGVLIQLLLTFGSILIKQQLKGLDSLYGTFAVVLGLLFWIYLLAQVIVYSIEIDTVRSLQLWPRSIAPENKTTADNRAYDLYVKSARRTPEEKVFVQFDPTPRRKS